MYQSVFCLGGVGATPFTVKFPMVEKVLWFFFFFLMMIKTSFITYYHHILVKRTAWLNTYIFLWDKCAEGVIKCAMSNASAPPPPHGKYCWCIIGGSFLHQEIFTKIITKLWTLVQTVNKIFLKCYGYNFFHFFSFKN